MAKTRLIFSTDVHGSEMFWRKWLRSGEHYNADVIIMSGDLTGKAIVPIIKKGEVFSCEYLGRKHVVKGEEKLQEIVKDIRLRGFYPYICAISEARELRGNERELERLFIRLMVEGIERWLGLVSQIVDKRTKVLVNPGNDDIYEIDEIIRNSDRIIYPLNRVVQLDDKHEMISCEWVNPTPWNSSRECPEEELRKKLEKEFHTVEDFCNLICNFHAPPFNTNLDVAPILNDQLRQRTTFGTPLMDHVGSTAVREVILEKQPYLSLHGHIHESPGMQKLGRTTCLNPGSKYVSGVFSAYVIDLWPDRMNHWFISEY
ncbi:MAG: phosphoesterase [Candidatus Hodarchaeota archaeon]